MIYRNYIKRLLDIILSMIALIVTLPINLFLLIATYFDVGLPLIFKQTRIGLNEKEFTIYKFRNMTNECDSRGELLPPEMRVTRFGIFVRKTSLDELLNFWSILKGDMSIIGPRPLLKDYLDRYSIEHRKRHLVRPGLACPNFKRRGYSEGWNEQFDNDVWYVDHVSFSVDFKMCLLLIRMVFDRKKRNEQAVTGGDEFIGYKDGKAVGNKDYDG